MTPAPQTVQPMAADEIRAICRVSGLSLGAASRYFESCHSALNEHHRSQKGGYKATDKWGEGEYKSSCGRPACVLVIGTGLYPYCPRCFFIDAEVVAKSWMVLKYLRAREFAAEFDGYLKDSFYAAHNFDEFCDLTRYLAPYFYAMESTVTALAKLRSSTGQTKGEVL